MPTYTVRTTTGRLNGDARATLARAITTAHTAATGAQGFFAQVVFEEVDADRHFVGGAPIADELVFVHGQIRAGRTPEQKAALLDALGGAVREALGVPRRAVWVYLVDLPPANMVEYGYVLPAAGDEAAWLASLDDDTRHHLNALG
ncbi:tautomerase family protein [Propioniciclava sp. MC1595]|uniref:tautomerase family protein n=1 Tax=unclassified Propioniciclava TaxID=2642922 RepID=UPI001601DF9E|nr:MULTISPECIES: tautomerase family protein [unclassified Propioniciclava]MBB1495253.1 tautomerase family protein [Propioniciclava sp. MC1595]MBB1502541.1 tautomerase family protein [Propioniciclava sp. MC1683]QTE26377.1 tautomerase family protein [Propioniciclava sp. MC1595]